MVEVGEVQVLLSGDVGKVSLGFVNSLGQAKFCEVFLKKLKKIMFNNWQLILCFCQFFCEDTTIHLQVVTDVN